MCLYPIWMVVSKLFTWLFVSPPKLFFGRTIGVMHIQGSTYLVLSCHLWTHSWPVVFRVLLGGPCQSIETQCHLWNVPCLKKVRGLTIFLEGKMRFRFNMQMNFIMWCFTFEFFDLQDFLVRDAIGLDGFEEWLNVFHQKKGRTRFLELGYGSRRDFVHQFTQH